MIARRVGFRSGAGAPSHERNIAQARERLRRSGPRRPDAARIAQVAPRRRTEGGSLVGLVVIGPGKPSPSWHGAPFGRCGKPLNGWGVRASCDPYVAWRSRTVQAIRPASADVSADGLDARFLATLAQWLTSL